MLRKMLIGFVAFLILALIAFFFYINSGNNLPKETDKIVAEVMAADLPELVHGETGMAKSGNLEIWYEKINPKDSVKGTILLVMGHSSTAMLWTANFYQSFVEAGYQVIRYDNRDVGMSTWVADWDENKPYSLEDMAKDGIAVLDDVGVDKAHIIGASMGGMIAQRMAVSHSNRVLSLTSIMSSGYMLDPEVTPVSKSIQLNFFKLGAKYLMFGKEQETLKFFLSIQQLLKGNGPYKLDTKAAAERMLYEIRKRKGINRNAVNQQSKAIEISGSRLEELGKITAPTLVIHGKSDPLVIFDHAIKYAPLIPDAATLYIDGMGHDIPMIYMAQVQESIFKNIERTK